MKLSALVILSSALAFATGVAIGAEAKPAFKADPAKGQQLAAPCLACHVADGTRGLPARPRRLQGR